MNWRGKKCPTDRGSTYIGLAILDSRALPRSGSLVGAPAVPCGRDEENGAAGRTGHWNGVLVLRLTIRAPGMATGNYPRGPVFGREVVKSWNRGISIVSGGAKRFQTWRRTQDDGGTERQSWARHMDEAII